MGIIYGLISILFALVIGLLILVLKCRSDISFAKDMFKINNDYVKECEEKWTRAIKLCDDVCKLNERLLNQIREEET